MPWAPAKTDLHAHPNNMDQRYIMCKMPPVPGLLRSPDMTSSLMKPILLLFAAVLPLVLNSCSFVGETDPYYADGHRRSPYYGRSGTYTIDSLATQTGRYTAPSNGRSGLR